MSTKKGYIVWAKLTDTWMIVDKEDVSQKQSIPIHPDSLPTILSNGSLKPEYQGEVEYEKKLCETDEIIDREPMSDAPIYADVLYAIPKPVESKGDVWEELVEFIGKAIKDSDSPVGDIAYYVKDNFIPTKTM